MRFKLLHQLDLLELYGNHPKGDFTKPLGDGIFEVRAQNKTDITRIMFFFDKDRKIVLTNGFVKKTQRMPASELETAKKYRADYFARTKGKEGLASEDDIHSTIGPKWRPKLDNIVNEASDRSCSKGKKTNEKSTSKHR